MDEETYPLTELDRIANGSGLLMIKAMLPYLAPGNSLLPALMIKLMEMQNIRSYYRTQPSPELRAMAADVPSMPEILRDVIRFAPPESRETFQQFQNIMETMQMFESMQDMFGGDFPYGGTEQQTDTGNFPGYTGTGNTTEPLSESAAANSIPESTAAGPIPESTAAGPTPESTAAELLSEPTAGSLPEL